MSVTSILVYVIEFLWYVGYMVDIGYIGSFIPFVISSLERCVYRVTFCFYSFIIFFLKLMIYSIYVNEKLKPCAFYLEWKTEQSVIALSICETLFHSY